MLGVTSCIGYNMIRLEHVKVEYPTYAPSSRSIRQVALRRLGAALIGDPGSARKARALDDVSFGLQTGHRLAIFGANGSGKSTLLRVLAGVIPPTAGRAIVEGTVTSLTDFTYGMDFDLSGRRNIELRLAMMGYSFAEARSLVQEIVEFSGLGDYIHEPVRVYSTGMTLRLAFAIATVRRPDILVLDEMIATADKEFQDRAQSRLDEFVKSASILVLATHDSLLGEKYCNLGLHIDRGSTKMLGKVHDAACSYWGD